MSQHCAKWNHFFALISGTRAKDQPPGTFLLMLLDLVEVEQLLAALMSALMQQILDHGEGKQALALTHGTPACRTVSPSLPGGRDGLDLRNVDHRQGSLPLAIT